MEYKLVVAHFPVHGLQGHACLPDTGCGDAGDALMTVLFEDDRAAELYLVPCAGEILPGSVYIGKIEEISKSTGAAFVRFTRDLTGYLPLRAGLYPGREIMVQVEKEAMKTKLPRLTENIRLQGRFYVLSSGNKEISVSRKLEEKEKKRLRELTAGFFQDEKERPFGCIIRTEALGQPEEVLRREFLKLASDMTDLLKKAETRTCYSCLLKGPAIWESLYRQIDPERCRRIVTDDPDVLADLKRCRAEYPKGCEPALYQDPLLPLYKLYKFTTLCTEAISGKAFLPSGGYLIIEQTEAFVCIDVNSGRYSGRKNREEAVRLINREAAEEAARQIRLRQLSGTILIDFISMNSDEEREELIRLMRSYIKNDHARVSVVDITPLDIMELTREKVRKPVAGMLFTCILKGRPL